MSKIEEWQDCVIYVGLEDLYVSNLEISAVSFL